MDDSREDLDTLQRDPYSSYAQARQTTGLTFVPPLNTWLVAWDADACEVLRRPQDFSSANALCPDVPPTPAVLAELTNGIGRGAHRGHLRRRGTPAVPCAVDPRPVPRVDEVPDDLARHCCVGRRQDRVMLERVKLSLGPNLWLPPKSALAGFRFPPEVIVLAGDPATRRP